jgi:hypothetical protein
MGIMEGLLARVDGMHAQKLHTYKVHAHKVHAYKVLRTRP